MQPTASHVESAMTESVPTYRGLTAFERKLTGIVESSDTEDEEQSKLLMVLVREVHTIRWILIWVMIIVPVVVVVFGALLLNAQHSAVVPTTGY